MPTQLKKALSSVHLWALAVGLVISGEYFGWNYGWGVAGTIGFLIATIIVTVLYVCFIFSFTELNSRIPDAGGPFAFSQAAFGPVMGLISGYATLVEFVFAPPAIAFALGSYVHFLNPAIPVLATAIAAYVIFTFINWLGIKESANFNMVITVLAILELLLLMSLLFPHYQTANFIRHNDHVNIEGIFKALPFAVWLYLGIEGVAMVSEEVKDPKKNIQRGYLIGMFTLVFLALGVMILCGGIGDWRTLSNLDYPLPEAVSQVMGRSSTWTQLFAGIGLFGLVASFHGIIIGYSRQIFALSRARLLPGILSRVNKKHQTPHMALIAGGLVGLICLLTGTTNTVIIISALGAVFMYAISMLCLLRLRKIQPVTDSYQTPFYPAFPIIALVLSVVCLIAIIVYNLVLSLFFFGILAIILFVFIIKRRNSK